MPIQKPLHANRFKVVFPFVQSEPFTDNVSDVQIDFRMKTLSVNVRQSEELEQFRAMEDIVEKYPPYIYVYDLSRDEIMFVLELDGATLDRHTMYFDYSDDGQLLHNLRWSFNHITSQPTHIMFDDSEVVPITPREGDITPQQAMEQLYQTTSSSSLPTT